MKKNHGLTMLEVIVWVSVFTVVLGAIVIAIIYFYRTNTYTLGQATAVSSGQRGLDNMMRVIREAAYASDGAYPIISMATSSFSFYADVDTDASIEKIRYFLQGTSLFEGIVNPSGDPPVYTGAEATSTAAEYIRNIAQATSTFRYYDKNGALMSDYSKIGDVRFVTVNLIIDVDTNRLPDQLTLRSSAGMRNLVGY
ncbi:hypothetical protein HYW59_00150 [Candidatus Kaiserbacteria bacterium]|nr:hypothetical protein [Candidatus Kaiserbacteria bacterium]